MANRIKNIHLFLWVIAAVFSLCIRLISTKKRLFWEFFFETNIQRRPSICNFQGVISRSHAEMVLISGAFNNTSSYICSCDFFWVDKNMATIYLARDYGPFKLTNGFWSFKLDASFYCFLFTRVFFYFHFGVPFSQLWLCFRIVSSHKIVPKGSCRIHRRNISRITFLRQCLVGWFVYSKAYSLLPANKMVNEI